MSADLKIAVSVAQNILQDSDFMPTFTLHASQVYFQGNLIKPLNFILEEIYS
jgi:hypothetical protein